MSETTNENTIQEKKSRNLLKKFSRGVGLLFFLIFLLFGVAYFSIQIPFVQDFLVSKITETLQDELHTEVRVGRLRLSFYDKLLLENVLIRDEKKDTLLYVGTLGATFNTSLPELLGKRLKIVGFSLTDAYFRMAVDTFGTGKRTNFDFILEHFASDNSKPGEPKSNSGGSPFIIELSKANLVRVRFELDNKVFGEKITASVNKGSILVNDLRLHERWIDLKQLELDDPVFTLTKVKTDIVYKSPPSNKQADEWCIFVDDLRLNNGGLEIHNFKKRPEILPGPYMDYQHLSIKDINTRFRNLSFSDFEAKAVVDEISARTSGGFHLEKLKADHVRVNSKETDIFGLRIKTDKSDISDTLMFRYNAFGDFEDFTDKVIMDGRLKNSTVLINDIINFAPGLDDVPLFHNNKFKTAKIRGRIYGKVNSLKGTDFGFYMDPSTTVEGYFSSRNLSVPGEGFLSLTLKKLTTTTHFIQELFPDVKLPENVMRAGHIQFSGNFDGFFDNFVAYGTLNSDLGNVKTDINLDIAEGKDHAKYSGNLVLNQFNLGLFLNNKQLGKTTANIQITEGRSLALENLNAKIEGLVKELEFKGYKYHDANVKGIVTKNLFDGDLSVKDENVDIDFSGKVDFSKKPIDLKFKSYIGKIDFRKLNLLKDSITVRGIIDTDIKFTELDDVQGTVLLSNAELINGSHEPLKIGNVNIVADLSGKEYRFLTLQSDMADLDFRGKFDMDELAGVVINAVTKTHPNIASKIGLTPQNIHPINHDFYFDGTLKKSEEVFNAFNINLDSISDITVSGRFANTDTVNYEYSLVAKIPYAGVKGWKLNNIDLNLDSRDITSDIQLSAGYTQPGRDSFEQFALDATVNRDSIKFHTTATSFYNTVDSINLRGKFNVGPDFYELEFLPSQFVLLDSVWNIQAPNYIKFGKNEFIANDLIISSKLGSITLISAQNNGVTLALEDLDVSFVNNFINYNNVKFGGTARGELQINNIFSMEDLVLGLDIKDFFIGEERRGVLQIDARMKDLNSPLSLKMNVYDMESDLSAMGFYYPKKSIGAQKDSFNFKVAVSRYPLQLLEYIIPSGIKNTTGLFDAHCELYGTTDKPEILGQVKVIQGNTTVSFLGTKYFMNNQIVNLSSKLIDFNGVLIMDELGNFATVEGGITHEYFKKFGLNTRLKSDKFLGLNTTKKDNPQYYGKALGKMNIRFRGDFKNPDIYVVGESAPGTRIFIPITQANDTNELSFITFINTDSTSKKLKAATNKYDALNGVNLEMDLTVNENAEIQLIFDEKTGDIIKSRGKGNLKISMPQGSNLRLYGDYEIVQGDYLFTLLNIVNKPFTIKSGGTISWNGDPFAATLDISAEYKGLSTSPYNLIAEYLSTADATLREEARKPTTVNLTMRLTGLLTKPDISFDIDFPNLTSEIKSFTDSKLRVLAQDPNELNKQVAGLILMNGFLPSTTGFQTSNAIRDAGVNTLSQFLGNQISNLMRDIISDAIKDVPFVSGIDFDVGYNIYTSEDASISGQNLIYSGQEFQVRMKNRLFDDRLSVNLGTNVVSQSSINSTSYIAADVSFEYALTPDRRYILKYYIKSDQFLGERKYKYGLGISYRKEFDSFGEFVNRIKKNTTKAFGKKEEEKSPGSIQ